MGIIAFIAALILVGARSARGIFFVPGTSMNDWNRSNMDNSTITYEDGNFNNIFPYFGEFPYDKGPIKMAEQYDFIVVGSGAAGSVVANRLSEVPNWDVLLLEAGKTEMLFTECPIAAPFFQATDYAWHYKMEKQDGVCLAMVDQQCSWPRGKALGGTTVINGMIYTRGNKRDFDKWAAQGNPGWSWDEVLPYYKKSERAKLKKGDPEFHNTNGYLNVEDVPYRTPIAYGFAKSATETGRKKLRDYNGKSQFGFSTIQGNIRNGRRCSATKAFLYPARNRKNLRILPLSRVVKLIVDADKKTAVGVEYIRFNQRYMAFARKEVILSAGTFNSPQLLMLAGIGPKDHLQELGIPVIKDLPVGQTLIDHIGFPGMIFLVNYSDITYTIDKVFKEDSYPNWVRHGQGPLTSINAVEGIGYIKTGMSKEEGEYPDIELLYLGTGLNVDGGGLTKDTIRLRQDFYNNVYSSINYWPTYTILPMLLHPKSRGYLKLKSTNPFHWPLLYGNYFTDPEEEDLRTMVEAIKEIIKLSKTKSLAKFGSTLHETPFPGCSYHPFGSDDYWKCALRHMVISLHHQVGTCRMGPANDPEAVVDPELKVHGIDRLRVVDTSVIPVSLSAHVNAPAFMIGEKAADFIKATWNGQEISNDV